MRVVGFDRPLMTDLEPSDTAGTKVPRWMIVLGLIFGSLVGVVAGVLVGYEGGIPHAYDRFGVVAVPGRQVLTLPAGRVMLDHADDVYKCWDNTNHTKNPNILKAPTGMAVRVMPTSGSARPLAVTKIPQWLYQGHSGCRGHVPFGRIDTPAAGKYLVETSDDENHGFSGRPDRSGAMTTASTSGTGIAFGPLPWAPFGSPILSGLLVFALVEALVWVPWWVWRRRAADRLNARR